MSISTLFRHRLLSVSVSAIAALRLLLANAYGADVEVPPLAENITVQVEVARSVGAALEDRILTRLQECPYLNVNSEPSKKNVTIFVGSRDAILAKWKSRLPTWAYADPSSTESIGAMTEIAEANSSGVSRSAVYLSDASGLPDHFYSNLCHPSAAARTHAFPTLPMVVMFDAEFLSRVFEQS